MVVINESRTCVKVKQKPILDQFNVNSKSEEDHSGIEIKSTQSVDIRVQISVLSLKLIVNLRHKRNYDSR